MHYAIPSEKEPCKAQSNRKPTGPYFGALVSSFVQRRSLWLWLLFLIGFCNSSMAATPFNVIAPNTPSAFGFYGTAYATATNFPMTITTYDGTNINTMSESGWEINITQQTSSSNNIKLSATNTAAVQEGDLIVATFYYRRNDSASGAEANFTCDFESITSPNTQSFSLPLRGRAYPANSAPPNGNPVTAADTIWRRVSIPFTSAAAYAAGAAQFNFYMGAAGLQTLDIADVSLTDYGQTSIFGNTNSIDSTSYFTSDITSGGVTYGTITRNVAISGLPLYSTGTQIQTTVAPPQTWGGPPVTWNLRLDNRLPVATNLGDTLVAIFWMRATALPTGAPYAVAGITATGCAGGSFNLMVDPNAGWREWIIPLKVVKAETAYNTDFYINFGFQLQTVQVAGLQVMYLGQQLGGSGVQCTLTNQANDYPGRALSDSWRTTAAANIAQYRQGTLTVNVTDGSGNPLSGVTVAASMTAPSFGFGCQTSSTPIIGWDNNGVVDQTGVNLFYQLFNHVEMGCYKWGEWETGAQPSYNAKTLDLIRAKGRGTFDFRAHNLIWPADSLCPSDVASINTAAAMTARIDGHITAMVGDPTVHGYFSDWDAVNEPYDHNDEMQVENGLPRHTTGGETQPFGSASVTQAQNDALAIAPWLAFIHATDTHPHLFINDWGIETNTNHIDTSHEDYDANLLTNLENANAHIDGFGFESHFVDAFTPPLLLTKMFSRFANGLAPGHSLIENVTEFDESESSGMAAAFPPDIDLYTDFMNDYLTEVFSQPNFDFFDLWTLGDMYNAYPIAGTNPVQNNWVLMPQGEAWMSLARNQWWTNTSAVSDTSGIATLSNCFLGRYCLTATSGSITKKFYTDLLTTSGNTTPLQLSGSTGNSNVWLYEAEKPANAIYSPLAVYSDPTASGGQYVAAPVGGTDNSSAPTSPEMRVDTEAVGTVNIWMRVIAPNSSEDSFWMAVDNGTWQTFSFTDAPGWHWVKFSSPVSLAAGTTHTLFLAHGKCGAELDQVLITDDLSYIPESATVFATSPPPPTGTTGTAYNYAFAVFGSPASTFSLTSGSGSLPAGLTLSSTGVISGTPTQFGTFSGTASATNNIGAAATKNFTVTVLATFNSWASQNFIAQQSGDPTISGPTAMPQNDGVPNLLKYLYNINPTGPMSATDRAALPTVGMTTTGGVDYLTLSFRQYALKTGITINVQTSSNLQTWTTVSPLDISQQLGTDSTTGDPIMEVGVKLTGATKQFIRLNVTQP